MTGPRTAKAIRATKTAEAAKARRLARLAKSARGARSAQTAVVAALGVGMLLHPGEPAAGGVATARSSGWVVQHVALTTADPEPGSGGGESAAADGSSDESGTSTTEEKPTTSEKGSEEDSSEKPTTSEKGSEGTSSEKPARSETTPGEKTSEKPSSTTAADATTTPAKAQPRRVADRAAAQAVGRAPAPAAKKVEDVPAPVPASVGATTTTPVGGAGSTWPTSDGRMPVGLRSTAAPGEGVPRVGAVSTAASPATARPVPPSSVPTESVLERLARALVGVPSTSAIGGGVPVAPPLGALVLTQWALFRRGENPLFNRSPIVRPGQTGHAGDGSVTGELNATDPDHDRLTYTVTGRPSHGTVVVSPGGGYVYTPDPGTAGPDSFTVTIRDNDPRAWGLGGLTAPLHDALAPAVPVLADRLFGYHTVVVTVTVTGAPANRAPVVVGQPVVDVDPATGVVTGNAAGSVVDADGDALTYSGTGTTPKGSVVVNPAGVFVYTPTAEARDRARDGASPGDRTDVVTIAVSDGRGGVTSLVVPVAVVPSPPVDRAPVLSGAPVVGTPNPVSGRTPVTVTVTDPDGDTLDYRITQPAYGTVTRDPVTGVFTYVPTRDARAAATLGTGPATDSFAVTVSDGRGGVLDVPVTGVPIARQNPFVPAGSYLGQSSDDVTVRLDYAAEDVFGDPIPGRTVYTAEQAQQAYQGSQDLANANGTVVFAPGPAPAPGSPFVPPGSYRSTTYSLVVTVTASVVGPDGEVGPAQSVTYRADDVDRIQDIAFVDGVLTVVEKPHVDPTLSAQPAVTPPNVTTGEVDVTLTASDADGDALRYDAVQPTSGNGSVIDYDDGTFAYVPTRAARIAALDGTGPTTDTFTVVVTDDHGGRLEVPVTVDIARSAVVAVASFPYSAAVSPDGSLVYVTSFPDTSVDGAGRVTVIDAVTREVVGEPFEVGTYLTGIAVEAGGDQAYVADFSAGTVSVIDTATGAPVAAAPVTAVAAPTGVALSPDGSRVYVTSLSTAALVVVDTATGQVVDTVAVGDNPSAVALSPSGDRAYVVSQFGTLTVVDTTSGQVVGEPFVLGGTLGGIVLSPDGTRAYVTDADTGTVRAVDTATGTVVGGPVDGGGRVVGLALSPDGSRMYVVNPFGSPGYVHELPVPSTTSGSGDVLLT